VVEIAVPAAGSAATPGAVKSKNKAASAKAPRVAKSPRARRPAARPAPTEPREPATVTATKEYIVERDAEESMDDFLL